MQPTKVKFKKIIRGNLMPQFSYQKGFFYSKFITQQVLFFTKSSSVLTAQQVACGLLFLQAYFKKRGSISVFAFPHKPVSKKAVGLRMGKGKSPTNSWVSNVACGNYLFGVSGLTSLDNLAKAQHTLSKKLSVRVGVVISQKFLPWSY